MDLNEVVESVRHGLQVIPHIPISLVLLAGPTAALVGYRLISAARRTRTSPDVGAAPLWVCPDCRSVNELRVSHCYRCGLEGDQGGDVQIVVEQPAIRPMPAAMPAGSPFAAVAAGRSPGPGIPVMAAPETLVRPVAVGPGREDDWAVTSSFAEPVDAVEIER
jgi:hypothetical protein